MNQVSPIPAIFDEILRSFFIRSPLLP